MQVIQETSPGGNLGYALGKGLGSGLEALAQMKLQRFHQNETAKGFESIGYSPEESRYLSKMDPKIQQLAYQQKLETPARQAYAQYLSQMLNQGQPSGMQMPLTPMQQLMGATPATAQPNIPLPQSTQEVPGITPPPSPTPTSGVIAAPKLPALDAKTLANMPVKMQKELMGLALGENRFQQQLSAKQTEGALNRSAAEKRQQATLEHQDKMQEKRFEHANQLTQIKYGTKVMDDAIKNAESAQDQLVIINRMRELNNQGVGAGIIGRPYLAGVHFLEKLTGKNLDFLKSKGVQEWQKLEASAALERLGVFKGKVSNYELMSVQKTVPTLSNSQAGRDVLLDAMSKSPDVKILRAQAVKEILEENKGVPPLGFSSKIYERVEEKKAANSQQVVNTILNGAKQLGIDTTVGTEETPKPLGAREAFMMM